MAQKSKSRVAKALEKPKSQKAGPRQGIGGRTVPSRDLPPLKSPEWNKKVAKAKTMREAMKLVGEYKRAPNVKYATGPKLKFQKPKPKKSDYPDKGKKRIRVKGGAKKAWEKAQKK